MVLLVITVLLVYLIFHLVLPFASGLSWALALGVAGSPLHRRIVRFVKRPDLSAGISVAIVTLMLVAPVVLISTYTVRQGQQVVQQLRSPEAAQKWERFEREHPRTGKAVGWVRSQFDGGQGGGGVGSVTGRVAGVLSGTLSGIIQLFIALFALFFLLRDRNPMMAFVRDLLPLTDAESTKMFRRVADTVYATLFGHVGVALIQGTLGGLMFWFLGIPAPLLWGAVMGVAAIVPMLGAFVVWMPAAVYLALTGQAVKAAILVAWGSVVVGLIDNILYPIFVGDRLRLHTFPVFISIIGGLSVFGSAGIVLGPLVLAVFMAVLDVWKNRTRHGRGAEQPMEAKSDLAA